MRGRRVDEELFRAHLGWAESIGEAVHRRMPFFFDVCDLRQEAVIEHWHRVERYDPARNDNYRAYAYFPIHCAVLMFCRRRNYREATHEELLLDHADRTETRADVVLLEREERRNVLGPRAYRQLQKVRAALPSLMPADAYLVRRVYLEGADEASLCELWHVDPKALGIRLRRALAKLKREVNG